MWVYRSPLHVAYLNPWETGCEPGSSFKTRNNDQTIRVSANPLIHKQIFSGFLPLMHPEVLESKKSFREICIDSFHKVGHVLQVNIYNSI